MKYYVTMMFYSTLNKEFKQTQDSSNRENTMQNLLSGLNHMLLRKLSIKLSAFFSRWKSLTVLGSPEALRKTQQIYAVKIVKNVLSRLYLHRISNSFCVWLRYTKDDCYYDMKRNATSQLTLIVKR